MSNGKNRFESGTLKGRMKELISISLFSLAAVFLSLILSDLVFFPLAYYSVRNVNIFNILFRYMMLFSSVAILSAILYFKVRSRYRDGYTKSAIVRYVLLRPFQYAGFFLFTVLLLAIIITIIYVLFSSNFYHLHRIAGGA